MNVSQYSPNRRLERDAIGSIDKLASVKEALAASGCGDAVEEVPVVRSGTFENDDAVFRYSIDALGRCIIDGCDAKVESLVVPATIDGCEVAVIGGHSFSTCYSLAAVELPATVEEIREHAFMNTALTRFNAPSALRRIGDKAFYRCEHLESVRLDGELRSIGAGAFRESALAHLSIPAQVGSIGRDAFKGTRLVFSGDARTLDIAEDNVRYGLQDGALYEASGGGLALVQVLDEGIERYEGISGLTLIGERALAGKRLLREAVLPEGVLAVGEAAFKGCVALTRVTLPDSLRSIGRQAFRQTALQSLRIPHDLEAVGGEAFYTGGSVARDFRQSIRSVEVAPGNESFYLEEETLCQRRDGGDIALLHFGTDKHIVIPKGVTAIGPYAFLNSKQATAITMHDRVADIDVGGLDFGRALSTVVFETGVGDGEGAGGEPERYVINYPPGDASSQMARITFGGGNFDVEFAYAECDRAILHAQDLFTRSRMMVERLEEPVFMSERVQALFRSRLKTAVPSIVAEFGRNGYLEGIDSLLGLGILGEDNIQEAIDAAAAADEVAAVSRLVEIRRTRFGMPMFDFDL